MSTAYPFGAPVGSSPLSGAPLVAEVVRNGFIESVHHGVVAAVDATGRSVINVGPIEAPILPRSSLKPLQVIAMLRAGAQFAEPELLALASASHSGESFHREGARRILASVGLHETDLQNTPSLPLSEPERDRFLAEGIRPSSLAQNCSGKHSGMLAACVAAGWDTQTYLDPAHPLQQLIVEVVEELTGDRVAATTVDGCGAPALAVTTLGLARAFGRIAAARRSTPEGQLAAAIRAAPAWLGGTGRDVTRLIEGVPGLIAKDGAESVYAVGLADGSGLTVKIADGYDRARVVVMTAALRRLGALDLGPEVGAVLDALDADAVVKGHGEPVGAVRVAVHEWS
ncbi:MAG: asparaginase [Ornithinimicrobium sp.]|uniref:asparaginase n=1 Tax=Ornithinimicrobium sp. TaxID=1977084 RepID=UPI0026DF8908|nr:asparaginase [Ornithinimicrobium sp.]MDO5740259.1 asparaginase [Ornithinimicrobium sp.]